jgi:hypothetical protein
MNGVTPEFHALKPAVLFVNIGWSTTYDGQDPIQGNHDYLRDHADDCSEMYAFAPTDEGVYECGIGRGSVDAARLDVVFVARPPDANGHRVVGVYFDVRWDELDDGWVNARTADAILLGVDERPTISWPGRMGMRRWAYRGGAPGTEHEDLRRAYVALLRDAGREPGDSVWDEPSVEPKRTDRELLGDYVEVEGDPTAEVRPFSDMRSISTRTFARSHFAGIQVVAVALELHHQLEVAALKGHHGVRERPILRAPREIRRERRIEFGEPLRNALVDARGRFVHESLQLAVVPLRGREDFVGLDVRPEDVPQGRRVGARQDAQVVDDRVPDLEDRRDDLETEPLIRWILAGSWEDIELAGLKWVGEDLAKPSVDLFHIQPRLRLAKRLTRRGRTEIRARDAPFQRELVEASVEDEVGEVIDADRGSLLEEPFERPDGVCERHSVEPPHVASQRRGIVARPRDVPVHVVDEVPGVARRAAIMAMWRAESRGSSRRLERASIVV